MLVREIMSKRLVSLSPGETVKNAAAAMDRYDVGAVLVCEGDGLLGVVTDRDIVLRCISSMLDPETTTLEQVMTASPVTVSSSQSALEAAKLMAGEQVRRLPVVDNGHVVGILSIGDMARIRNLDIEVAMAFGEIAEPRENHRKH